MRQRTMNYGYIRVSSDKQTRKLYSKRALIAELMAVGMSQRKIAKICKVDRNTLWRFLKDAK